MPLKRSHSLFTRLARLRSRVRRVKAELSRLISVTNSKDLKFQLREARLLLEADDMLTPSPDHVDEPLRPRNCLIGDTPDQTIRACQLSWTGLRTSSNHSPMKPLRMAEVYIQRTIRDALDHAGREAGDLWRVATKMAGVANG